MPTGPLSADPGRIRPPVLLVPGWSDRARALRRLRDRFIEAGWASEAVAAVDFRDRFGSNVAHAREVAASAVALLEASGAGALDVVAHSMGGLAVRRCLADGWVHAIRRAVFLATPHAGTWAALLAWGGGRREMMPGSAFLRALPKPGVACVTIRAPLDLRVFPATSARLDGATDVVVDRATHQGLLRSRRAFDAILAALAAPLDGAACGGPLMRSARPGNGAGRPRVAADGRRR